MVVLGTDRLAAGVVGIPDLLGERGLGQQLADAVDRSFAAESGMRSLPVVEGLPLGQLIAEIGGVQVGGCPELLERCAGRARPCR